MNVDLRNDFERAGVLSDIYAAMDTDDMAKVVRATMNGLHKINEFPKILLSAKSKEFSTACRVIGNESYKAGKYRRAVQCYNQALASGPKLSNEIILAYSNRSAVFFNIRYFTACIGDINICLSIGCSERLAIKLRKRRDDATPFIFEENLIRMVTSSEFVNTFFRFNCNRNPDVPCASADVAFVSREGVKRATAGRDIKPGVVVAIERAFVTSTVKHINYDYLSCYFCSRSDLCLYPCEGCCQALFCGEQCRDRCMKEYHSIECQIVDHFGKLYDNNITVLVTRTAIKMSLKMKWNELIAASKDIGVSRMKTATAKQTFNSEEPLSILSYIDNEQLLEGRMFNGSIFCAFILYFLSVVPNYFPKEPAKREAALDAMGRIMLYLYMSFNNKIYIVNSAYDFNTKTFKSDIQISTGWFSMSSKLKHSCEPNLLVVGLNDSVALLALRTIKRGEELTISYGGHFYDAVISSKSATDNPMRRVIDLFLSTRILCGCRVCLQKWDRNCNTAIEMTKKQSTLLEKVNKKQKLMTNEYFNSVCAALDVFPINSLQHRDAYDAVRLMLNTVQSKWYNNFTYL